MDASHPLSHAGGDRHVVSPVKPIHAHVALQENEKLQGALLHRLMQEAKFGDSLINSIPSSQVSGSGGDVGDTVGCALGALVGTTTGCFVGGSVG